MRHSYIVSYDISDPKRLRKVYQVMLSYGDHIQLSVFRCELNSMELTGLKSALRDVIHAAEDQVLFVSLGPVEGRARTAVESLGKPYQDPERLAVVV